MADPRSQNWLLISFDQWHGDWHDQPWLRLPVLQQLARQGWDLRRCYTSSPQCIPASVSWLTCQSPTSLGLMTNRPYSVSPSAPSFVRQLRDEWGYRTVVVGKTHWTPPDEPCDLRDNLPLMEALGFDHVREIADPRAMRRIGCELADQWRDAGLLQSYRDDLQELYSN